METLAWAFVIIPVLVVIGLQIAKLVSDRAGGHLFRGKPRVYNGDQRPYLAGHKVNWTDDDVRRMHL